MAFSRRMRSLKREIALLRRQFLPSHFNPLGVYSKPERVRAHTRGFIVLSHAEVESFLEGWAKEIARAAEEAWKIANKVTPPLAFLLSSYGDRLRIPMTLSDPKQKDSPALFADASAKLFQRYYRHIGENNGIKERNVLALFGPLGVPKVAFGTTLLPNLDSFGSVRGTHAHHSARAVEPALDPETEYRRVDTLLDDLTPFDQWLVRYKRRIR